MQVNPTSHDEVEVTDSSVMARSPSPEPFLDGRLRRMMRVVAPFLALSYVTACVSVPEAGGRVGEITSINCQSVRGQIIQTIPPSVVRLGFDPSSTDNRIAMFLGAVDTSADGKFEIPVPPAVQDGTDYRLKVHRVSNPGEPHTPRLELLGGAPFDLTCPQP